MQSRITGRTLRPSLALFLCLLPALPLAAQDDAYVQQVADRLSAADDAMRQLGYVREGEVSGWVSAGTQSGLIWTLDAGEWAAVAFCDDDCSDIDMSVATTDMQPLGEDRAEGANPLVRFSLAANTAVGVSVDMLDCGAAQCYMGVRWYRLVPDAAGAAGAATPSGSASTADAASTPASTPATDPAGPEAGSAPAATTSPAVSGAEDAPAWVVSIAAQLEEGERVATANGLSRSEQHVGLLAPEAQERLAVTLEPGQYWGFAVCDMDCDDLDLTIADGAGSEVSSDVLPDDRPIVEFRVATAQAYQVAVDMVACSTSTCGYGFRLYRKD